MPWRTPSLWFVAGSAFFADLGYQIVFAAFPLLLVLQLHAPPVVYGLTMAVANGLGALLGLYGGRLGDRVGHKRVGVFGNACIILLSLTGLATVPWLAAALFAVGWLARNFRSPSRRVMVTQSVKSEHRARAFGFLHSLDVTGGLLAVLGVSFLVLHHALLRDVLLISIVPLALSTLSLASAKVGAKPPVVGKNKPAAPQSAVHDRLYRAVLISSLLYGLSSFSLGFPILTVASSAGHATWGTLAYAFFLAVSALAGYVVGTRKERLVQHLSFLGYLLAGIGTVLMGVVWAMHLPIVAYALPLLLMGYALGAVRTLEPTLMSIVTAKEQAGRGMGALTATRSAGLFISNLGVGLLYSKSPLDAYVVAGAMGIAAAVLLLGFAKDSKELSVAA